MQLDCMWSNYRWVQLVAVLRDYTSRKEGKGASSNDRCQVGLHTDGCTRLPIHISGGNSDGSLLCIHLLDFSDSL